MRATAVAAVKGGADRGNTLPLRFLPFLCLYGCSIGWNLAVGRTTMAGRCGVWHSHDSAGC